MWSACIEWKCRQAWRTASAVPWNHDVLSGVCSAARMSTKPWREVVQPVALRHVTIERGGIELRQHEDAPQVRMQAVADRDVDEAVLAADRHGRLGTRPREREEAVPAATAQDEGQHRMHGAHTLVGRPEMASVPGKLPATSRTRGYVRDCLRGIYRASPQPQGYDGVPFALRGGPARRSSSMRPPHTHSSQSLAIAADGPRSSARSRRLVWLDSA